MKYSTPQRMITVMALLTAIIIPASAQEAGSGATSGPGAPATPAPITTAPSNGAPEDSLSADPALSGVAEEQEPEVPPNSKFHNDFRFQKNNASHNISLVRRIVVLRQLVSAGFSTSDIANAIHVLRGLRDAKSAPTVDPEMAMREEYQALLKASPGTPLPPSSAVTVADAARYYQDAHLKVWTALARRLGRGKADVLRRLLGQDAAAPLGTVLSGLPIPAVSAAPNMPVVRNQKSGKRGRTVIAPVDPEVTLSGPAGVPPPGEPSGPASVKSPPAVLALPATPSNLSPPQPEPALPGGLIQAIPGAPATIGPVPWIAMSVVESLSPNTVRISLDELIELLQEKLDVMTKGAR